MSELKRNPGDINPSGSEIDVADGMGPAGEELLAELDREYVRPVAAAGNDVSPAGDVSSEHDVPAEEAENKEALGLSASGENTDRNESPENVEETADADHAESAEAAGIAADSAETTPDTENAAEAASSETAENTKGDSAAIAAGAGAVTGAGIAAETNAAEEAGTQSAAEGISEGASNTEETGATGAGAADAGSMSAATGAGAADAGSTFATTGAGAADAGSTSAATGAAAGAGAAAVAAETAAAKPVPEKRTPTWFKILRTGILLAAIIGLFIFYYVTQSYQYVDTFMIGTYVNGNDVSGQTVAEIEEDIRARVEDTYSLTMTFRDGSVETITPQEIGYRYVSSGDVQKAMEAQNPLTWVLRNMGQTSEITVPENHTFDENKLAEVVKAMPEFQVENVVTPTNAYLNITDKNEFEIVPETQGNAPIADAILPTLAEKVTNAELEADLNDIKGAYETPVVTADNPDLVYQCDLLNKFLSTTVTYKLPNDVTQTINRDTLIDWITRQDNGFYYIDDAKVKENCKKYVADIAAKVDERHNSIPFQSTTQGIIQLSCAEYGRVIDQAGETEALYANIHDCKSEEKEPLYSLNKMVDATFGGSYVEADLTNQHVYLYEKGQLVCETDCVSGTKYESSRHTVLGLYSIYYKQRNRTLQGPLVNGVPSYTSFVSYWMAFYRGYGLHDASWRGSFGGTIYYYSGSHGCINLPSSAAATFYEHTEVGTPVIVFGGY